MIGPLRAKLEAVTPHLDERQRRLLYGAEARILGHGGIAAVAKAAGVSKGCVSRGLAELEEDPAPHGRTRRAARAVRPRPRRIRGCGPHYWPWSRTVPRVIPYGR